MEENIEKLVSKNGILDTRILCDIMKNSFNDSDRNYADAVAYLEKAGILDRETGFGLYAEGMLSLNPREGGRFGNQLYFSRFEDAEEYQKCIQRPEIHISIDRVENSRRVTSLK